eukprot:gnl/Chilomastix_caulleri/1801.p1 GENE.gnl/Chilomastix_caulleri/1801~~gnl/Chilomastix_caulleri/1801.p1  ORF type:complete len:152 (+),score=19.20 gnl/Chilomastix_caulleri/1801:191-646(+)
MWSCGCILGEVLGGVPMFPGTSTMNQLDRILELTGTPGPADIAMIDSPFAQTMLESLPPARSKLGQLSERFPTASKDALDLLAQMLQFNPTKESVPNRHFVTLIVLNSSRGQRWFVNIQLQFQSMIVSNSVQRNIEICSMLTLSSARRNNA